MNIATAILPIIHKLNKLAGQHVKLRETEASLKANIKERGLRVIELEWEYDKFDRLPREEQVVWDPLTDALADAIDAEESPLWDLENTLEDVENDIESIEYIVDSADSQLGS